FTLLMGVVGCSSPPPQAPATSSVVPDAGSQSRPSVVATTSILCDLTKQVAGETINLKCLVGPGVDPHLYQPKPEDRKAMDSANLIFYAGYDFDPSLVKLVKATSNPVPKIAVHEVAVPQPILGETHDHGDEKHAHAEGETAPDPHIWHDAQNGIRMVETISNSLEKLTPNHTSLYENNAQKITLELQQIDTWIKSQIATIPPAQRKLVTTHDALGYYVKAYGLSFEGALGGFSTEEAPTAARVSELVKEIKSAGVPTIFAETTINPKLIERVAKEAKVKVSDRELFADGLGEPGKDGESYQEMLLANTRTVVEGLGGQYTPFAVK
ncbi:MAG TPA: metal ABC transporter substrate-binding protein, partial [Cyanobacteria bacterium UBA12227]|nr:metal ABC transporter substrate-binding protein [Cyanobacteria bacterium UBA12227]